MLSSREHGGRLLAGELGHLRAEAPIVLGITRGGVPVALEVARALDAPLDLMVAVKVGAPDCPEHTVAAVAEGGATYVRREALRAVGLTEADATALCQQGAVELEQLVRGLRGDGAPPALSGATVLLVDDGVATGATACAAARAARQRGAKRVVLAAPVIAAAATGDLERELDEVVALDRPRSFLSLCTWYERLEPVPDDEILRCLQLGGQPLHRREADRIWDGEPSAPPAAAPPAPTEELLAIPFEDAPGFIDADLVLPVGAVGVVVFGTGSTRDSPRYRIVSRALHRAGVGSLRCDLFTPAERRRSEGRVPCVPGLLARRVASALRWIGGYPSTSGLHRGLYGAGAGAEAALVVAAEQPELVDALVVRAGQLDTVPARVLASVRAPVLLVVGSRDENVLSANRAALVHLPLGDLAVVPGVTDLFGEPGALEAVGRLTAEWFRRWLGWAAARGPPRPASDPAPAPGA